MCFFFFHFFSLRSFECPSCLSSPDLIQMNHPFVGKVFARRHPRCERHVLFIPVAQLGVTTCVHQITRLSDHKLRKLVDKCLLLPGQHAHVCCHRRALTMNELLQIHLFLECRLPFLNQHAVIFRFFAQTAAETSKEESLWFYPLSLLKILSDVALKRIAVLLYF